MQSEVAASVNVSPLSITFRTLNLLDKSMNVKKINFNNISERTSQNLKTHSKNTNSKNEQTINESNNVIPIISLNEVSWHDSIYDCWLVICDYVYDCTDFVNNHPGSQDILLEYAGRDATLAFNGTGHSTHAKRLLKKFLIGELPLSERIFRTEYGIKIDDFI